MSSGNDKTVDFVLVPAMSEREVVCLLLNRFPAVRDRVCPDEDYFEWPTIVYDSFATIVLEKSDDSTFIQSVGQFIDELAESKDRLIKNVLDVSLLEGIAADPQFARNISSIISPKSRSRLHEVERKFYGRVPLPEET